MGYFKHFVFHDHLCKTYLIFLLITLVNTQENVANSNNNNLFSGDIVDLTFGLINKCADHDFMLCLKKKAVRFIDSIPGDYEIVSGIKLLRSSDALPPTTTNTDTPASYHRSLPPLESIDKLPTSEREQFVDNLLVDRVARFLGTYTIQFRVPKTTLDDVKQSVEEGRKKKKKLLLPILLLLKLKAAILIPVVLGALALLAFKALLLGKIALLISGLIALKKILSAQEHHSQSYEVVAHPHHTYSSTYDDHGHYGRSMDDKAQNLAYSAHVTEVKP